MPLFYWSSHLETGNARIDSQHKMLFELTNRVSDAVAGQGRLPDVPALLQELIDYAGMHFCEEEKLMCRAALPEPAKKRHVCAHRKFIRQVTEMTVKTDLSQAEAVGEILEFLVNWLVTHILKMDCAMAQALPERASFTQRLGDQPVSVQKILISALTEAERRFRLLAEQAPAMIWFCGPSGVRDFVNRGWIELAGLSEAAAREIDWIALLHPDDQASYRAFLQDRLRRRDAGEIEYRVKASGGEWRWVIEKVIPRMDGEQCVGLVSAATDITSIKEMNRMLEDLVADKTQQLKLLAGTDPLTGLLNRRAFDEKLGAEILDAQRHGNPLAILFFDVDHFKRINDGYGHAAGDKVLAEIAKCLRYGLRGTDLLARFGGEEFVAVLNDAGPGQAGALAETLREAVSRLRFEAVPQGITISVGIASLDRGDTAEDLLARADKALFTAKRTGRNRCCISATATLRTCERKAAAQAI